MPFKSEAQRRKFYAMANRGEISDKTVDEWEDATPKGKDLPERVGKKEKKKKVKKDDEKKAGLMHVLKVASASMDVKRALHKSALMPILKEAAGLPVPGSFRKAVGKGAAEMWKLFAGFKGNLKHNPKSLAAKWEKMQPGHRTKVVASVQKQWAAQQKAKPKPKAPVRGAAAKTRVPAPRGKKTPAPRGKKTTRPRAAAPAAAAAAKPRHTTKAAPMPRPTIGEGVGTLGGGVGRAFGMGGAGGYLSRSGIQRSLREAGTLKGRMARTKIDKAILKELARRQKLMGYGTLGAGAAGLGGLGYLLGGAGGSNINVSAGGAPNVVYPPTAGGAGGVGSFPYGKYASDDSFMTGFIKCCADKGMDDRQIMATIIKAATKDDEPAEQCRAFLGAMANG